MAHLLRTKRTYKSRENAELALRKVCKRYHRDLSTIRWLIAVDDKGRFAPVVVGSDEINFGWHYKGITIVG